MEESSVLAIFSALSNSTRLRILQLLVKAGDDGMSAGKVAETVGATPSRASFHLNNLSETGLVESKRMSRNITYFVNFTSVGALVRYLTQDCCQSNSTVLACCISNSSG